MKASRQWGPSTEASERGEEKKNLELFSNATSEPPRRREVRGSGGSGPEHTKCENLSQSPCRGELALSSKNNDRIKKTP